MFFATNSTVIYIFHNFFSICPNDRLLNTRKMDQSINKSASKIYQNHKNVTSRQMVKCQSHVKKYNKSRKISKNVKSKTMRSLEFNNELLFVQGGKTEQFQNTKKKKRISVPTALLYKKKTAMNEKKTEALNELSYFSTNYIEESMKLFKWLIYPLQKDEFFE